MNAREFGFVVRKSEFGGTTAGYRVGDAPLFVDRRRSGVTNFSEHSPGKDEAPLPPSKGRVKIRIFIDRSSVEAFGNDGEVLITDLISPDPTGTGREGYARDGKVKLMSLEVHKLTSI